MIAIHASYFGDNFGDTLFVIQYVEYLKSIGYKEDEICLPFAGSRMRSYLNVSKIKHIKAIRKSDKVIFIGGGYFGERSTQKAIWHVRFWIRHISVALLAIFFNKKYMFFGVGAGPLTNPISRILSKVVIKSSEGFHARDIKSFNFLNSLGLQDKISLVADSLICYDKHKKPNEKKKRILLHLPLLEGWHGPIEGMLRSLYNKVGDSYEIIVADDFYKPSFNKISYKIAKNIFQNVTLEEYSSPTSFLKLINSSEIIFTVKLHVGILGLASGSKVISTYVHEKSLRFYNQIGLSNVCFNFNNISNQMDDFNQVVNDVVDNKIDFNLPSEILEKSRLNFVLLESFLDN
jgi:polysaccharide pyruvyl transferase WcaK-like protein